MSADAVGRRLTEQEDLLRVCLEFGLFPEGSHDKVAQEVQLARETLAAGNVPQASTHVTNAESALNAEMTGQKLAWRMRVLHQLPLSGYYAAWLLALGCTILLANKVDTATVLGIPASIPIFGALGAVLRGLMWLQFKVTRRQYRPQFLLGHLAGPPVGMLFAMVSYLLLATGVVAMTPDNVTVDHSNLPQLVAIISGFSWEWMAERIRSFTS